MRLLSWNIDSIPIPAMHMLLPKQESAHASPATASLKRKRALASQTNNADDVSEVVSSQSAKSTRPVAMAHARSTSPTIKTVTYQPSEGLPTPLLSPTESKMEPLQPLTTQVPFESQDRAQSRLGRIREVIQQQVNLEILLKHNELRLIDQELAKCQTAFEQLRRCNEIPYPSSQPSVAVSTGQGLALRSSFSGRVPDSPAPWGVTDGPYTRHLSQWLLPDPRFDGGEVETQSIVSGKRPIKRSARASLDDSSIGMTSRSQRSGKLQALPAGYGQPKEKSQGPLILKRKSDGVMVKLICPVCSRGDFGSAQGFINHCRIGHARNFSSHDQAAEQCGEPVETDAHGAVVGQELAPTPSISYVHPLIRTARLNKSNASSAPTPRLGGLDGVMDMLPTMRPTVSPDFRGSLQTPHLSDLIKDKGLGLNLQDIVTEAKVKIEYVESEDEDMEENEAIPTPEDIKHRHPHVAGTRGITKPSKSPATSPVLQSRLPVSHGLQSSDGSLSRADITHTGFLQHNGAEPSPTTESNQAPSLIDDDEEYEVHSPTSSSASEETDEGEVDFTVRDDDDFNEDDIAQPDSQPSCTQPSNTDSPESARARRPSALRSQDQRHETKHVTFVSENPGAAKTSGDKKRRKMKKN